MLNRVGLVYSVSSLCKIYVAWPFVSITPCVYLSKIFKSSFFRKINSLKEVQTFKNICMAQFLCKDK